MLGPPERGPQRPNLRHCLWVDFAPFEVPAELIAGDDSGLLSQLPGKERVELLRQSGRRSAAAAFLFSQRGFRVWLLDGGLKKASGQVS